MVRRRFEQRTLSAVVLFGAIADPATLMDEELSRIDRLLDDPRIIDAVVAVLQKRHRQSAKRGRRGTPAEVVVRMLTLKHLRGWSYERLEWEVRGNVAYRRFCRIDGERVPDAKTLVRLGRLLDGPALQTLFTAVTTRVIEERKTPGRRMRVDTTVVEAPIRYPTDSGICADGIRVLGNAMRELVAAGVRLSKPLVDVTRSVTRRVSEISQALRLRGDKAQEAIKRPYRRLLTIAGRVARASDKALDATSHQLDSLSDEGRGRAGRASRTVEVFLPRLRQAIRQTRLRVLRGISNSAGKILSFFDPDARLLRRGKLHKPTEFGQLALVQEAEGGVITNVEIVSSNNDSTLLLGAVQEHKAVFRHAPKLVAADRGFFTGEGIAAVEALGVEKVAIPKPGGRSKTRLRFERQRWFRRAKAWRTGSEARISRLKHRFGMGRSRYGGRSGAERSVFWAAIANNLAYVG